MHHRTRIGAAIQQERQDVVSIIRLTAVFLGVITPGRQERMVRSAHRGELLRVAIMVWACPN